VIDNCLSGSTQSGFPEDPGLSAVGSADRAAVRIVLVSPELVELEELVELVGLEELAGLEELVELAELTTWSDGCAVVRETSI
jgi:hypothetical protein